jgi:hypothetical protein
MIRSGMGIILLITIFLMVAIALLSFKLSRSYYKENKIAIGRGFFVIFIVAILWSLNNMIEMMRYFIFYAFPITGEHSSLTLISRWSLSIFGGASEIVIPLLLFYAVYSFYSARKNAKN